MGGNDAVSGPNVEGLDAHAFRRAVVSPGLGRAGHREAEERKHYEDPPQCRAAIAPTHRALPTR
ncbi:hypothetical protein LV35_04204 [Acinetobacter baumannii]|uniref:Uncharacterized protein n=1 Tax=Acinetobacter baumannii TaxID=470 RepID=A0AAJ0QT28_ACIBA|nr:hypothetical protein LV35_04204 [Acinetobacter baumannii]